jgi:hypothetical protein
MTNTGDFLKAHPICCFCGGTMPASTIDHQPAKIVFPDKLRPKGLEFPACSDCNRQTSADEALLAFVCRFVGSRRSNAARDFNRLKDIVSYVEGAFPGLLQRMRGHRVWVKERGVLVRGGAIDVNQPEVNVGLCRIAAKLALAIYYETQSSPAAHNCLINTQWTHSQNAETFANVKNIIQAMPAQATLKQGKWNTEESFFLKYHYECGQLFSVAIFHEAVALIASLSEPHAPHGEKWQFAMSPLPGTGITVLANA